MLAQLRFASRPAARALSTAQAAPRVTKTSTGLVGLPVCHTPIPSLLSINRAVLDKIKEVPEKAQYRINVEAVCNYRIKVSKLPSKLHHEGQGGTPIRGGPQHTSYEGSTRGPQTRTNDPPEKVKNNNTAASQRQHLRQGLTKDKAEPTAGSCLPCSTLSLAQTVAPKGTNLGQAFSLSFLDKGA